MGTVGNDPGLMAGLIYDPTEMAGNTSAAPYSKCNGQYSSTTVRALPELGWLSCTKHDEIVARDCDAFVKPVRMHTWIGWPHQLRPGARRPLVRGNSTTPHCANA